MTGFFVFFVALMVNGLLATWVTTQTSERHGRRIGWTVLLVGDGIILTVYLLTR